MGSVLGKIGLAFVPVKGGKYVLRAVKRVRGMRALQKVLPNTQAFLKSADAIWKQGAQGKLTNAGRALQKHSGRKGSAFSNIKFSGRTANKKAKKIIQEIMNSKNQVVREGLRGGYEVYDTVTGRGFAISRNGVFNGFRNY